MKTDEKSHEEKSHWADRWKKAAAGIMTMIAVEQGIPSLPDFGPGPVIVQTMDTVQPPQAATQQSVPVLDLFSQGTPGFSFLQPLSSDPIDRVAGEHCCGAATGRDAG